MSKRIELLCSPCPLVLHVVAKVMLLLSVSKIFQSDAIGYVLTVKIF